MSSIKNYGSFFIATVCVTIFALFSTGCTPGLQSGSIDSIFSGVQTAKALSPTAIQLDWIKSSEYTDYKIYVSYQQDPLATSIFATHTIENLTPNTLYRFKVVANGSTGSSGGDIEYAVSTWSRFEGISGVFKDADGNLVVSWNYANPVEEYQIFYQAGSAPTAASTNNWATPNATTRDSQYIFKNLTGSTTYYFTVHAKYRQGEYERPDKTLASDTSSSFPAPYYELPKITIGSLPTITVAPVISDDFPAANYTSQAFKGSTAISDPVKGAGKATFSSTIPLALGKVDDISLRVNFKNSRIDETLVISGLSTYLKGVVPYVDSPPIQDGLGPAYLGRATAVGDFNCDGYDDLAVGMPQASLSQFGVTTSQAGAVVIYYGGYTSGGKKVLKTFPAPRIEPALPGKDPQILTFPDLTYRAQFGYSLASRGNMNGDRAGDYSCDDLAVGAPYQRAPDGRDSGNVFLFFGTSQVGIKAPATIATFPQNIETCDGREEGSTCSAVRLWPQYDLWNPSAWGGGAYAATYDGTGNNDQIRFGFAVSFVGDYNADGFEDLAIGAPYASWDGVSTTYANDAGWNPGNVGYVAMYFGSAFGVGTADVKAGYPFRWVKIYPSVVQPNMRFGSAISAGDVDGRHRILYPTVNGNKYVGGSDMVIGAPGFGYTNPNSSIFPMTNGTAADNQSVTPYDGGWWGATSDENLTTSRYGLTRYNDGRGGTGKGIAFVYFGRSSTSKQTVANTNVPNVETFWGCGERGMNNKARHFSCLANSGLDQARLIFPRDNSANGFGTSLRVLGDKSARDSTDELKCKTADQSSSRTSTTAATGPCRDPNGDSFAEILVGAPNSSPTSTANTGVIWQFFGNYDRIYEAGSTDNFQRVGGQPYYNTSAVCENFGMGALTASGTANNNDRIACRPTRLLPNAIPSGTYLGQYQSGMAVGDVTRDGLMDLAVGAPADSTRGIGSGAAYIFTSLRGAGVTSNFKKMVRNATNEDDQFGYAVSIGDFDPTEQNRSKDYYIADTNGNADVTPWDSTINVTTALPLNDLVAGAPNEDASRPAGGGIHLFNSGSSTLAAVVTVSDVDIYDSLASLQDFGYGESRIVGDINGDGYDDAVSHIQGYNSAGAVTYDAIVYYGSAIGLVTTRFCLENQARVFKSGSNAAECYPSRTHATSITNNEILLPQKLIRPNNVSPRWGDIGFNIGDVNADGFADVTFLDSCASTSGDTCRTQVLVYYGTRGGLQDIVIPSYRPATNDPQIVSTQVTMARSNDDSNQDQRDTWYQKANPVVFGDFNGDGYSDFAIANPQAGGPRLSGYTTAVDPITGVSETIVDVNGWPVDSVHTATTGANMLWRCSAASALNGNCTGGGSVYMHGLVYIFYGTSNGVASPAMYTTGTGAIDIQSPGVKIDYVYNTEDSFGLPIETNAKANCTSLSTGTDPAVAGYNCIPAVTILRNPVMYNIKDGYNALNHRFGSALTVMKINNSDMHDTLLISSPGYEHPDCLNYADPGASASELNQGRIFVFRGSKFGLTGGAKSDYFPTPAANNSSRCLSMPKAEDKGLGFEGFNRLRALNMKINSPAGASNTRNRQWGLRMGNAGDINGDGFEDLLVTAPYENVIDQNGTAVSGAGAGYVIYGPLCPTDNELAVQNFVQDASRLNVQQKYADVVASTGVTLAGPCSGKTLAPQKFRAKDISVSDSTNKRYGFSIATSRVKRGEYRGDINLDKFSDVVFASPYWDDSVSGKSQIGRGIVLFGSPNGLFTDDYPSSVVEPLTQNRTKPYILLPPTREEASRFYEGNISTGDVNGDHSMDLMVPSFFYDSTGGLTGIDLGTFFLFY